MTTLESLIAEATAKAINSEAIKTKVEYAAAKAVDEAISRAFDYSSDFRKAAEKAVKEAIPMPKAEDCRSFGLAVQQVVQRRLAGLADELAEKHIGELLDKLIGNASIIYIDDLEQAYKEKIASSDGCDCHEVEDSYQWEVDRGSIERYWDLHILPDAIGSRYGSESMTLRFRETDVPGESECWNVRVGGKDEKISSVFTGPLFGFDAMVFRLATRMANITTNRKPSV